MDRVVIVIDGPDSDKALGELISNAQFDKLEVAIWIADEPEKAIIKSATLSYSPQDEKVTVN